MRNTLIISLALALSLSACGKSEEAAQAPAAPEPPPAAEAPAPEAPAAEAPAAEAPPAEAPAAGAPEAAAPAAIDAGAKYASTCAGCHGPKGEGQGTFPKLAGQSADAIKSKLTSYKAGKQVGPQSAMMYPIAGGLSDEEIAALATHIAAF